MTKNWKCANCRKYLEQRVAFSTDMKVCAHCELYYCGNCYSAAGVGLNAAAYVCFARQNHNACNESVNLI